MWRSRMAVQIGTTLLIMGDGVALILKQALYLQEKALQGTSLTLHHDKKW